MTRAGQNGRISQKRDLLRCLLRGAGRFEAGSRLLADPESFPPRRASSRASVDTGLHAVRLPRASWLRPKDTHSEPKKLSFRARRAKNREVFPVFERLPGCGRAPFMLPEVACPSGFQTSPPAVHSHLGHQSCGRFPGGAPKTAGVSSASAVRNRSRPGTSEDH